MTGLPARLGRLTLMGVLVTSVAGSLAFAEAGCKKKITSAQCDDLLDHFAQLVVRERMKDATPEQLKAEQAREREEALNDDNFKNCTSELSIEDYECARKAASSDAVLKCLE